MYCDGPCDTRHIGVLVISSIIVFFAFVAYGQLVYNRYQMPFHPKVQILNLRMAIMLPMYALLFLGILLLPHHWEFFEAGISFVEGYCIFSYYKMLSIYVGGKERVIDLIKESDHTQPCCYCCQKNHPRGCHAFISYSLGQFAILRPLLFLAAASLNEIVGENMLSKALNFLCVISLIVAMICLIRIYHVLAPKTKNLSPATKVLFIKGIILLLVIQNLVVASIQHTGIFDDGKHIDHDKFNRVRQVYAFVGLGEILIFTFVLQVIFKLDPDDKNDLSTSGLTPDFYMNETGDRNGTSPEVSLSRFVFDILSCWTLMFESGEKSTSTSIGKGPYNKSSEDNEL